MRIVVKVGTSTLAHPTGRQNIQRMERLCKVLSDLKNAGHEVILVSSGAIAMGVGKLNLPGRPADMPTKQAAAAIGQCELMYFYDKLFTEYNHTVAQLLITAPDIAEGGVRKENFHNTLERLLDLGALPVINENDTISTDEIVIGDNDTLSATVAATVRAELLILLSDIDGLYDSDPHKNPDAKLISVDGAAAGRQVDRHAADVGIVLLAAFGLLVRLQLADGLEAVADGDAVRLGELDLRGHTGRRVVNTEGPQLGAAEHQLAADLQGQLTLLGDVVVHELREIDVRGDGDDALLHSRAAVFLGALEVVLVVPAARGADVNLFHVVPPIVSASSGR